MNAAWLRSWPLLPLLIVPLASGAEVTVTDREASYPIGVENITQDPWRPHRGEDVRVVLRLDDGAAAPDSVSLLYCRVEPTYVCGLPFLLERAGARTWAGEIEWNPRCREGGARPSCAFMLEETVHVGYNVTMRFPEGSRVSAPVGNYWVPETYPSDADGVYYFMRYEGALPRDTPLPAAIGAFALVAGALWLRRRAA